MISLQINTAGLQWRQVMLLSGLVCAAPAQAALSDTIHPFVGVGYSYDSNLFRTQDTAFDPAESDRIRQAFAGVQVDTTVGRQRLTGSAKVSKVSFDRFSMLDYNAKDFSGTLYWQLGNHLDGTLGGTYSSSLTSFADYQGSQRNLRVQKGRFVDGGWRFHPSWRVRGRLATDTLEYDLPSQQYLDREDQATEAGLDYLGVTGSTVGLQLRRVKGTYQHPLRFGTTVFDQGYTQDEVKLKVYWKLGEVNQLLFLGGRARRTHHLQSLRDSSGTNGRVTDTWLVTPSVSLVTAVWREFAAFEGSTASYSLNKGVSAEAKWSVTSKIQTTAQLRYIERDFAGFITQPLIIPEDKTQSVALGVNYTPLRSIVLSASLNRDQRKSNTAFSRAYHSTGAAFNATIEF